MVADVGGRTGAKPYQLYVQAQGRWRWLCSLEAGTHSEAFKQAMLQLKPEHYDKPIRLEQAATPQSGDEA